MTEIPRIVAEMRDAINAADWNGFVACFAPDPVVNDWGDTYAGIAARSKSCGSARNRT